MKANILLNGSAAILQVTAALAMNVDGRLSAHGHQHGDVLGRIMHKPTASSGSSFLVTATKDFSIIDPAPTKTPREPGCSDEDCASFNATDSPHVSTHVLPVPQLHFKPLGLMNDVAETLISRRRQRLDAKFNFHDGISMTSVGPDSPAAGAGSTEPSAIATAMTPILPAKLSVSPAENVEAHVFHTFEVPESRHHPRDIVPRQDGGYESFVLGGFSSPTTAGAVSPSVASVTAYGYALTPTSSSSSAAASTTASSSMCPSKNGTMYNSADGIEYQILCNVDYVGNNFPFQLVDSFAGCIQKCDAWNFINHHVQCIAALFIPSREGDVDDCYLKSNLRDPYAASVLIEGAIRIGYATSSSAAQSIVISTSASSITSAIAPSSTSITVSSSVSQSSTLYSTAPSASVTAVSSPGVTYASGSSVVVPKVDSSNLHGPTQNTPSQQYLDIKAPAGITLASSLLTIGVNGDLSTGYDISIQTGVLEVNISTQSFLSPLKNTPHLSRDGGRGGMVNGEHLFVFCDTGSYSTTTATSNGNFLGFVSSSVAIDVGMKGLRGGPLSLQDGIGEWSDDAGRMRGFAPLTEGEMAYNQVMQGQGGRYAVWPEGDIIPLDATTGIMYAPIVYDNVNELTKAAVFTYTGATLLKITAGGKEGPVAQRSVEKIFQQGEVEWGCSGGIRSWGASGIGGDDGKVYVFGNVAGGILLGRTTPTNIAEVNSFQYWNGKSWSNDMPTSSSNAFFINGAFMDLSVFYSPRYLTFIIVYLTIYADSTFYYRYLEADQGILPPFASGGDSSSDYVENIVRYNWSEQQVLYKATPGLSGKYIYSGGPHLGYYGSNDISNGGSKMLLSWTAPTGLDPSTLTSEYQIVTAEIDWA